MTSDPVASEVSRSLADVPVGAIRDRLLAAMNLMGNTNRGWVAEAIVAVELGAEMVGEGYGDWDLEYRGNRIEVKAAGEIQAWPQRRRSAVTFNIAPTEGYVDEPDGVFVADRIRKRRSDAYVFCHHKGTVPDDPADWDFYVVPTSRIDARCDEQKSISLGSLKRVLDPVAATAADLKNAVDVVIGLRS